MSALPTGPVEGKPLGRGTIVRYWQAKEVRCMAHVSEKDCAGMPTSTRVPVSQLKDDLARLVVTTIQKMATAVRAKKYENVTDVYRTKRSCDEQQ